MQFFDYFEDTEKIKGLSDEHALLALSKPSLFKIKGRDSSKAVLISVLIHGNEPSGFRAFLKEINSNPDYLMDVYFLVGNVKAAQQVPYFSKGWIEGSQDFNRIWKTENPQTIEEKTGNMIFDFLKTFPLTAHLDIHTFTAKETSPHGFISPASSRALNILKKMAPYVLVLEMPLGTMLEKISSICPSFAVECGTNNSPEADNFAFETLQRFLGEMNAKAEKKEPVNCIGVFTGMVSIKVKPETSIAWVPTRQPDKDLTLRPDVNTLNFQTLPKGTFFAWGKRLDFFLIQDKSGVISSSDLFELTDKTINIKKDVVPALLSKNEQVLKACGFYFFLKKE